MLKILNNLHKTINNENGSSMVELMMVMMLMAFFGITIVTLINVGSKAQQSIIDNKDEQINARIAMSYVNVRVRQNDAAGKIHVLPHPTSEENAIFIQDFIAESKQNLWIFWEDGYLKETMITDGDIYTPDTPADSIIPVDWFDVNWDEAKNMIQCSILYAYGDSLKTMSSGIYIRSQ